MLGYAITKRGSCRAYTTDRCVWEGFWTRLRYGSDGRWLVSSRSRKPALWPTKGDAMALAHLLGDVSVVPVYAG